MLEKILAYSRTRNNSQLPLSRAKISTASVDLAVVVVHPSQYLYYAQLAIYSFMLVSGFIALLPFFLTKFYWVFVWLAFAILIAIAIYKSWRVKNAGPLAIEIKQNIWRLKIGKGECVVRLSGEVLLWSCVIIIPVREILTRHQHHLIILPDSLPAEDWRRLRLWLMTCL